MNTKQHVPVILSYSRIIITFIIIAFLQAHWWMSALLCFSLAALTDWVDGFWARRFNAVTRHGAYIDPLADKILILGTLGMFVFLQSLPFSFFLIITGREVGITMLRSWCEVRGKPFLTARHGKCKTVFQMILIYTLFSYHLEIVPYSFVIRIGRFVVFYSIVSGLLYCYSVFRKA